MPFVVIYSHSHLSHAFLSCGRLLSDNKGPHTRTLERFNARRLLGNEGVCLIQNHTYHMGRLFNSGQHHIQIRKTQPFLTYIIYKIDTSLCANLIDTSLLTIGLLNEIYIQEVYIYYFIMYIFYCSFIYSI